MVRVRAISPVIAMIIIVAITLAIAFAVVGWLYGIWGGLAGGTPQITITNVDGYIENNNIMVRVYMMNRGTAGDEILEARIVHAGEETACNGTGYVVNAGFKGWLTFACQKTNQATVGDSFMLKIFFKNSGVLTVNGVITRQVQVGQQQQSQQQSQQQQAQSQQGQT